MFIFKLLIIISIFFISSCNRNLTKEEKAELWSKAQTREAIIERSGTKFNSAIDPEVAMRDAETRLQSGGGLLGKGGLSFGGILNEEEKDNKETAVMSMPVNIFLWRSALETVDFMPLNSADPIGGTILTDWYSGADEENERCKLNIFITGKELKTQNLKVTSFCQEFKDQKWVDKKVDKDNNIKIENAILNKAKKLKIQSS